MVAVASSDWPAVADRSLALQKAENRSTGGGGGWRAGKKRTRGPAGPPGTRLYGQMPERRLPHAGEDQHLDGGPPALAEIVGNQSVGLIDGCDVPRHVVSPLAVFVSLAHL